MISVLRETDAIQHPPFSRSDSVYFHSGVYIPTEMTHWGKRFMHFVDVEHVVHINLKHCDHSRPRGARSPIELRDALEP